MFPFPLAEADDRCRPDAPGCSLSTLLPPELWQACQTAPHLHRYVHSLPIGQIGVPTFCSEGLSPKQRDSGDHNLIYALGDGLFVHVFADEEDARSSYILLDPTFGCNVTALLEQVGRRLVDLAERLARLKSADERAALLEEEVERLCAPAHAAQPASANRRRRNWLPFASTDEKIPVTQDELTALKYVTVRDRIRVGILEPYLRDPYIEDIGCSGIGPLFIEHRVFGPLKTAFEFAEPEELDEYALRLAAQVNKPVTHSNPICDATLPDDSRINIVYGGAVSRRGSNFSVRKFTRVPLSILDLVAGGTADYRLAAYLSMVVGEGLNLLICGESASGKTTIANAISAFIPGAAKVVTLEDTPEIQLPHANWTRELVRDVRRGSSGANITMLDLLKAALRQRPNVILIGEIRGEEANIAFQAMQTGHQIIATFHASTVEKVIQRLTGIPINVPRLNVDNLNVVIFVSTVRLPSGRSGRRITHVAEIAGYDASDDAFDFAHAFRWDARNDQHQFAGHMNSYILEEKISPRLGLSGNRREIYEELDRRATTLEKIHKSGVTDFYKLHKFLESDDSPLRI